MKHELQDELSMAFTSLQNLDTSTRRMKPMFLILVMAMLAACGGGGDEDEVGGSAGTVWATPPAAPSAPANGSVVDGVFRDANVAGLEYFAPGIEGVTSDGGRFNWVVGGPITFKVGELVVGTALGSSFMTPVRLASGSDNPLLERANIARFLQMLDQDGDPENGIVISNGVKAMATGWPQINFLSADLAAELVTIMADANAVDGTTHILPSAEDAVAHLKRTYYCTHSGLYRGTFTGSGANGVFALVIYDFGRVFGQTHDNVERGSGVQFSEFLSPIPFFEPSLLNLTDQSGFEATGVVYPVAGVLEGSWTEGADIGTFLGSRSFGSDTNAVYRMAGYEFPLGSALIMSFEIDASDQVTGQVIDLDSAGSGVPVSLTGTLNETTLTANAANGAFSLSGTFDKSVHPAQLRFTGTLQDTRKARTVGVNMSVCRLN